MFIKRNIELTKVQDFMQNVKTHMNDDDIPYEVYESEEVVGWNVEKLRRR